jgi:hypothetical protein
LVIFTKKVSMKQTFTSDHLIRLLYNETSLAETIGIVGELEQDLLLLEEYEELREAVQELPKVLFSPSPTTISQILEYSERAKLEILP